MNEVILSNKKHGMPVLLLTILLYVAATLGTIFFATSYLYVPMVIALSTCGLAGWSCPA